MSKENGGSNQQLAAAANKFARMGSNRNMSPSANKYRVSSFLAATGIGVTTTASVSQSATPSSPVARRLHDLVRQASVKGVRNSLKLSDAAVSGDSPGQEGNNATSPTRGKLPHKIRASVTRMRSQLDLTTNNSAGESPTKSRQRHGSFGLVSGSAGSTASASVSVRRRSSRQRHEKSNAHYGLGEDREGSTKASPTKPRSVETLPTSNSDPSFVLRFMELLRPLQTSMSSLRDAADDEDDDDEEEADALFRQHEREHSRILRICCSLDNLLFGIADQVQEHNNDLLAIARGPARDLVQLVLNGIGQIVTAMSTTLPNGEEAGPDGMPSLTAKEERYLRDFLVEIADRWSTLDELLRGIYVSNLETVQRELADLQTLHTDLKAEKQALELEIMDIREFSSNQSAATMAVTSNFMRLTDQQDGHKRPEIDEGDARNEDERLAGYELKENQAKDGEHRSAAEEIEMLKNQCEEYGRLLEMAKQEIRLSHQERQSQHARLKELSQSLLKDEEVAQLRNELQCEKKRVKLLEMESLSLRETQIDLNLKIQSLIINQPSAGVTTTASSKVGANSRGTPASVSSATAPQTRSRSGSAVIRPEEIATAVADALAQHEVGSAVDPVSTLSEAEPTVQDGESATPHNVVSANIPATGSWLLRMVERSDTNQNIAEDDGLVRRFLADLLMTDKELEAAAAQSKLRRRSNVPTTGSPPTPNRQTLPPVKKKKANNMNAVQDPNSIAVPVDEWANDPIVVASVRQLIWVFFELLLMSEEARRIDPELCGRGKWQQTAPPPLASFVLHYFLERHANESEALQNLRRFVLVLSRLRVTYGDIELFCEFLEGVRSREELNFFLWVLQAVEAVQLGVNYDTDAANAFGQPRIGPYLCTLKALYVSRMVYQLLHVKSLKKPAPATATTVVKPKTIAAAGAATPPVASSPSKKRRKSRPNSASALVTSNPVSLVANMSATIDETEPVELSVIAQVKQRYARAIDANSGFPLTLESFNNTVLSFADTPPREELQGLLGPFYRPTGDERKVALDVFLVLVMEMFTTQLQWRKTQLLALFVRLAKEEEVAALLAAKIQKDKEDEAAAAQGKKGRAAPPEKQEKTTRKLSPSKKRQRRVGLDGNNDKYLRSLTRERLRKFLVQGGLVADLMDEDVDALYVALLDTCNRTPSEIHFEDIYSALVAFELLGNDTFAVDFSTWEWKDSMPSSQGPAAENQLTVIDQWRQLSDRAIALTENDPNKFTRRSARDLLRRLTPNDAPTRRGSCDTELATINTIRRFLSFAWRVACRRVTCQTDRSVQLQWCLTEFYYLNQAILTICNTDDHYASKTDLSALVKSDSAQHDQLSVFYATNPITHFLDESSARDAADLQRVILRYAFYIAHLFDSYSSARYTSGGSGLTKDQWVTMARELRIVRDDGVSLATCEALFVAIAETIRAMASEEDNTCPTDRQRMRVSDEFAIDRPHFVVLLVQVAVKRYASLKRTLKGPIRGQETPPKLTQIVDKFCRDVIVPKAFAHRDSGREDNFHRKLASPLVANVLLEHRAFLRRVFFQYAKHDHQANDPQDVAHSDTGQLKSKHNSLVLHQFTTFLADFGLLEPPEISSTTTSHHKSPPQATSVLKLDTVGAAYLFRAVMAIESADDTHMEFDEFASAIAAIAALRNPHPFLLWHVKIDAFVQQLHGRAPRARGFKAEAIGL